MKKTNKFFLTSLTRRNLIKLASFVGTGVAISAIRANRLNSATQTTTLSREQQSNIKPPTPQKIELLSFNFETITVDLGGQIISRTPKQAQYFLENLGQTIPLEMVALSGGTFLMGAAEGEKSSYTDSDKPQHQVSVKPFYIGKYPITQAQWKAIASLPKVKQDLNPDPSYFKGDNLPVERVSWYDALELCERLSQYTGRNYQLPSEAQWEYACRGGTTTPFYFGATITGEFANYFASESAYQVEPNLEFRKKTTEVGSFPPNDFGLYDLHGNVYEWCADPWHKNYDQAPTDGSVWLSDNPKNNRYRILRGGGWATESRQCRSAQRTRFNPENQYSVIGLRVVINDV
ncbi:protein of unknown function DUF323 [Gloeothece citriformis PCC 7424]|uniref:Sulfatase-modifying factor enzyme-like domain-containing protein n=1 Tax=Gloeothece citriformis (strain PCC 7424) TaxID=65393 RepID=B7KDP2_GLOC7|nr:formylglycine-generating enzyme family protein [Gloeothece citriformis]ACK70344.1 protein of unknown function DUF323 [Gloeothece citriformis PCC 7424]